MPYRVINPHSINTNITSKSENITEASHELWKKLSDNIKQHVPIFYFSVGYECDDKDKNKIYHFDVKETLDGENVKSYIKEYSDNDVHKHDNDLLKTITQIGGKYKHKHRRRYNDSFFDSSDSSSDSYDDSDSDSDSDSNSLFMDVSKNPYGNTGLVYYPTIYGIEHLTIPSFTTSFTPFVNIAMKLPIANVTIPLYST